MTTIPVTVTVKDANGQTADSVGGSVTPGSGTPVIVDEGETTITPIDDNGNGNLLLAQPLALSNAGTIQSLSFYVKAAGGQLRLGLYSNISGKPGIKLAETAAFTPAAGWNTQPTLTNPTLPAGNYFMANLPQSNTLAFRKAVTTGTSYKVGFAFGVMPSTFPSGATTTPSHWSLYGTFQESGMPTVWVNSTSLGGIIPPGGGGGGGTDIWAALDGRSGASSGPNSITIPTLVNSYAPAGSRSRTGLSVADSVASGNYQPPWMIAGVDYPVGPNVTSFKVPGVDPTPTGCTLNGGSNGFNTSAANVVIDGWLFDGAGTESGGVDVQSGASNTTITNNKFIRGAGIVTDAGSNGGTIKYNIVDQSGLVPVFGSNFKILGNGSWIVEYNYHAFSWNMHQQYAGNPMGDILVQFNLFYDGGTGWSGGAHAEASQFFGSVVNTCNINFNTVYQDNTSDHLDSYVWSTINNGTQYPNGVSIQRNTSVQLAGTGNPYHNAFNKFWVNGVALVNENYADISGVVSGWLTVASDAGPYPACTITNTSNIAMKTVGTVIAGQNIDVTDHG